MGREPPSPRTVWVVTLGCPKNEADSRAVTRLLRSLGINVTDTPEEAGCILINTCGFIQEAKEESIAAILEACADYPGKQVLVMGCLVERYREELSEGIPEVSGWFGVTAGTDYAELVRWLDDSISGRGEEDDHCLRVGPYSPRDGVHYRGGCGRLSQEGTPVQSYAYLKISDGCDELCTFCAIPGIKGPYHPLTAAEILREADACLAEGVRELVLVGQDTAVWRDGDLDLAGLIDRLAGDERVRRVRVMYLQPDHVTAGFLEYMASQPKLCRYLDIPFQHSHPDILRAMGRKGSGDEYLALLKQAESLMPDVSVRSTFIVGFPGEEDEHFEHLLDFVEEAGFDYAGGFVYSPEEGTPAVKLRPRIRRAVARERLNRLNTVLEAQSAQKHRQMVGTRLEVLVDSLHPEEWDEGVAAVGRIPGQAPEVDGLTYVEGALPRDCVPGDVLRVTITGTLGYDLSATV